MELKKAPIYVKDDDKDVNYTFMKKYMKAEEKNTIWYWWKCYIYMLYFNQFEKHTMPKWSVVHKIIDKNVQSYKLDNGKFTNIMSCRKYQKYRS